MTNTPTPAEELRLLDQELRQLDARRAQLLARRAWLLGMLGGVPQGPWGQPQIPGRRWGSAPRAPGAGWSGAAPQAPGSGWGGTAPQGSGAGWGGTASQGSGSAAPQGPGTGWGTPPAGGFAPGRAHARTPVHPAHPAGARQTAPEASGPRVQNLLLLFGGLLLTIAALAFTLVSWGHLGIGARAAVLAAVTATALGAPVPLLRRGLRSTAEALSALGLALTLLDAYALHTVALPDTDGTAYAAASLTLLTALWTAYGTGLPKLRLPVPAAVALGQAPLLLLAAHLDAGPYLWSSALLLTAAADLLLVRRPGPLPVRLVAAASALTAFAVAVALAAELSAEAQGAGPSLGSAALLGCAGALALTAAWRPGPLGISVPSAATGGLLLIAAAGGALRTLLPSDWAVPGYLLCALTLLAAIGHHHLRPTGTTGTPATEKAGWDQQNAAAPGTPAEETGAPSLPLDVRRGVLGAAAAVAALIGAWALPAALHTVAAPLDVLDQVWGGARGDLLGQGLDEPRPLPALLVLALLAACVRYAGRTVRSAPEALRAAADPVATVLAWSALYCLPPAAELPYPAVVAGQSALCAALLLLAVRTTEAALSPTALGLALTSAGGALCLSLGTEAWTLGTLATLTALFSATALFTATAGLTVRSTAASGAGAAAGAPAAAGGGAGTDPTAPGAGAGATATAPGATEVGPGVAGATHAPSTAPGASAAPHAGPTALVAVRAALRAAAVAAALAFGTGLLAAAGAAADWPAARTALLVLVPAALAVLLAGRVLREPAGRLAAEVTGAAAAVLALGLAAAEPPVLALVLALCGVLAAAEALHEDRRRAAGLVSAVLFVLASWVRLGSWEVTAPEAYTLPATVPALLLGLLRRRRDPGASSWTAYGPGLAATLLPSLVATWLDGDWQRPLLLGLGALALTLAGAHRRLAAPLLLGGSTLVLVALHELAPFLVQLADALPRWVPPALAGLLLLAVGATYERRLRDARRLRGALSRMR
ncbi:putative acetoacetyl CoA reductase [Streptomyces albus]|uniref:Putative acetoacetyl CoA reductase n=1 Tax=Streptomyces albus (strain ATCC 21838 / DSM 41398 / FERM P-419 / JCM 4703 / NBRC 107858) TaxID=1081613 RepID=A0A0B5F5E0_STRA4|nr:putative acetoacetyl CoA reductase [Streptomyces albus]AYN36781.1 hypothetical protein DUI70_6287 [Streptomyces albus]